MRGALGLLVVLLAASPAGAAPAASGVASVPLPRGASFWAVEANGARLVLTGTTTRGADCAWVTVDPGSLRVGAQTRGKCERPSFSAHRVVPIVVRDPTSLHQRVKISRLDPRTHRISYGPVVMTFDETSDTHLEWTYGPGSLWLFDTATTHGAEVLQVSAVTGRVESRVRLPRIFRPLLAANLDGLWLAIATNGGAPGRGPAPLYRVAPGARSATLVHRGGRATLWLAAAGHTVWANIVSGLSREEIWRFDGPGGRARALASADRLNGSAAAVEPGSDALWTLGDVPKGGKFFSCTGERVVRIDARTGRQTVVATVHLPEARCGVTAGSTQSATFAYGALYFLDASATPGRLYRVESGLL